MALAQTYGEMASLGINWTLLLLAVGCSVAVRSFSAVAEGGGGGGKTNNESRILLGRTVSFGQRRE